MMFRSLLTVFLLFWCSVALSVGWRFDLRHPIHKSQLMRIMVSNNVMTIFFEGEPDEETVEHLTQRVDRQKIHSRSIERSIHADHQHIDHGSDFSAETNYISHIHFAFYGPAFIEPNTLKNHLIALDIPPQVIAEMMQSYEAYFQLHFFEMKRAKPLSDVRRIATRSEYMQRIIPSFIVLYLMLIMSQHSATF